MLDLTAKYYPREVYSINESVTMENMRKYDRNIDKWYQTAEKMFPNFYKMRLGSPEKIAAEKAVNEACGFKRGDF